MSVRNVEQEFDALKTDVGTLSADLVRLTEALRELTGEGAQGYWAKLRSVTGQASEEVHAASAALGARGREGIDAIERQVRANPLMSILICLGLGLVIGKLLDR